MEVRRDICALQLRTWSLVERPAFFALAAVGLLRTRQVFALANVEGGQVARRRQTRPNHALAIDVDAARIVTRFRHLEHLGSATLRRIVAALQPNQVAREILGYSPHRVVHWAGH